MHFFFLVLAVCARHIVIPSRGTFVFFQHVEADDIYKFVYSTDCDVQVSIYDPAGTEIIETTDRSGTVYTQATKQGRIKMAIQNRSPESCAFAYKCPDPDKELPGHLGYIKDTDLISELTRVLDELVSGQSKLIKRTIEHKQMVGRTQRWAWFIFFVELFLSAFMVLILHRNFIATFEKKETL